MPNVKTAVSIHESLFRKAEALARKLAVSRSQLFTMALENFVREHENKHLFQQINSSYAVAPDPAEQKYQERMRDYQRQRMKDEW